jgi:predicted RNA-binding protein YlxR (DUF448 family)
VSAGVDSQTAHREGPVRTCVGCRSRAERVSLLRVVVAGGVLVVDPERRLPGRGASVHPDVACVDLADKRRAFARALRVDGPLDAEPVRSYVQHNQTLDGKQVEKP